MVAIFTGLGAGAERGSVATLGGAGLLGGGKLGRSGEQVMLNAANGNLLIQQRDEMLVGRGPDAIISRTYNSLGDLSDDNHDNWRMSTQRQVRNLTGTLNTWGSTVDRVSGDGTVITYAWNGSAYAATDGAGAYDKLTNDGTWRWTDGDSQAVEVYGQVVATGALITQLSDTSGNTLNYSYAYSDERLTQVATANGEYIQYGWSGNDITQITSHTSGMETRTRYAYDGYHRLTTVTVDLTPGDNSIADGKTYVTSYTYVGTGKLVASIAETDGSSLSIGYDNHERVVSLTETVSAGLTRVTTISYGENFTNITDPTGQTTRLDYAPSNFADKVGTWQSGNLVREDATIDGQAATKFTVQASGQWSGIYQAFGVIAGETLTWGLTLQAAGSITSQTLGLYSDQTGWGTPNVASARIVSGPGTIEQYGGGAWRVVGLSTTQGTRIEISRTYDQSGSGGAYFYVDEPGSYRAGAQLIAANATLVRSITAGTLAQMDLTNWNYSGVSRQAAGTIDGAQAYQYMAQQTGVWAGIATGLQAKAGDTYTLSMSFQAVGGDTTQDIGLYGNSSGWGWLSQANARIISGPGTITSIAGGLFRLSGLSTTTPTRFQITRTYDRDEYGGAYFYVDNPGGYRAGVSLIASAPKLTRSIGAATAGQLLKITAPPASSGAAQQVTQFAYDDYGNVASVTDAAGNATTFTYDANGNVLTLTDRLGNVVTRTYGAKNELLTETRTGSDASGAAVQHTTRYVYDSNNRLCFTISAEGEVSQYTYDGAGENNLVLNFTGATYDCSSLTAAQVPSAAQLVNWITALADPTAVHHVQYVYDARGNVLQQIDFGASSVPGNPLTADGYTHAFFTYDRTGQLLSRVKASENTEYYVYDGLGRVVASTDLNGGTTNIVFADASNQTIVTLANGLVETSTYNRAGELIAFTSGGSFAATTTDSYQYDADGRLRIKTENGLNTYYVYDKVGRLVGQIGHSSEIVEYRYDADDRVIATARYALGANSGASLADPNNTLEMSAFRPAAHGYDIWNWTIYDKEGRVFQTIDGTGGVTANDYDGEGRLVRSISFATKIDSSSLAMFRATPPTTPVVIGANAADHVSRIFYDKDGRVVGSLDGEGYLTRTRYDAVGNKVEETAFATATNAAYRVSGSFDQLTATTATSSADRTVHYVYDKQGNLRFAIDALNFVTEFRYVSNVAWGATGVVRSTIQYAGSIAALSSYTLASVQTALGNAGLINNANNRTSWAVYDAAERLAYAVDATGAVTGYAYDAEGHVIRQIQYANQRTTTSLPTQGDMDAWVASFATASDRITRNYYSERGELKFVVDAEGFVTRFDYDADGRKIATVKWDNAISVADADIINSIANYATGSRRDENYYYDDMGRLRGVYDDLGNRRYYDYYANGTLCQDIRAIYSGDESRTVYTYDGAGRAAHQYDAYGTVQETLTQYSYDAFGNVTATIDPNGNTTTYTYDHAGRLVGETNPLGGVTTYSYDAFGDRVKTVDANGNASYAYYDVEGRVVSARDAEDYVTETSYTVFGDIASVTRRANRATNTASVSAPPAYVTSAADATTLFGYDKLGRVTSTTDAEGAVEYTWYNAFGQVSQTQSKLGLVTGYAYYRTGRLYYTEVHAAVYDAAGNQTAASYLNNLYVYDARGNVVQYVEAYGLPERRDTVYVYDKADRVIQTHRYGVPNATGTGTVTAIEYTRYDARGNVIESDAADGGRTLYYYDKLDRVVASVGPTGTLTTTSYTLGAGTSGGSSTTRVYASLVSLPATPGGTPPSAPGGDYRETTSNYDKLGRLATTSVAGVRTGSWTGSYYTTGVGTVTTSYAYDAMGNVLRVTDGNGRSSYATYDRLGRKVRSVDGEGYITGWLYDAEGNVWHERRWANKATSYGLGSITDPATSTSDRITEFTYDRMGRRLTETRYDVTAYTVDGGGNLSAAGPAAQVTYTYNALGEVTSKHEATGDTTIYSYDTAGRLAFEARQGYTDYTGASVQPVVIYRYDALGNLVYTYQTLQGDGVHRVTSYVYGAGGRLTQMTDAAGSVHRYYYDAVGRKVGEAYDRVKSDGVTVAHEGQSYGYDLAGNLVRQAFATVSGGVFSDAGDVTTLGYNAYGELVSRSLNGTLQEQNRYDTAGHLWASSSGDGVWRYYLYDAAGNRTLELANEGRADLVDQSLSAVLAIATANGAHTVGAAYIDGINATVTAYDARNLATSTIQFKRQLNETATPVDIASSRTYNAFGETVSETDALGYTTTYAYNKMGRALTVQHAAVSVGNADGTVTTGVTPTDTFYYDISGRLIGQQDAGGNRTTRKLLAGTGYGSSAALVVKEYHPDTGVITNAYDAFGDLRTTIDEIGRATTNVYDAMGRLTQVDHAGGLVDYYANDVLGQRTRHWNSVLIGTAELTDYDVQGRVTASVAFGGDTTTTSYTWNAGLTTTGLGSFGGYTQLTTYANGRTATDTADAFGHVIGHTDLGGHVTAVSYDLAGRLTERTVSGETQRYAYLNTGLAGSVSSGAGTGGGYYETAHTTYGYDKRGLKTSEYATDTTHGVIENATATWDALGRMASWAEAGNATTPAADQAWSYDAVGNVRRRTGHSNWLNVFGAPVYGSPLTNNSAIYQYDAMNRMTGGTGVAVTYNAAGQRMTATGSTTVTATIANPDYDPGLPNKPDNRPTRTIEVPLATLEHYAYDAAGNLATVRIAQGTWSDNYDGTVTTYAPTGAGALKSTFGYDGMGRQVRQQDWTGDGSGVAYDRQVTYDAKGRVSYETDVQKQGNDTYTSYVSNAFADGGGTAYALGAATASSNTSYKNGAYQSTASTATSYGWYDAAVQSQVDYSPGTGGTYHTWYTNSATGVLQSASVNDGRPRSISLTNDALGQALRRDEADNTASTGDPHELWYRFNGKQIGYIGNNDTDNIGYAASLQRRVTANVAGPFKNGQTYGAGVVEFDQAYDAINSYQQGAGGGSYTVRDGDSLSGIAAQLWGDAGLWYKLAQANGLSGDAGLAAGQTLSVPAGVVRSSNNAATFRPYDVTQAYGDSSPTTPAPQAAKKNKCGAFGQILMIAIAIAVVAILKVPITNLLAGGALAGAHAGAATVIAASALAGAAGSAVSQAVGVATGIQDKFDWKGVALAGISAGLTQGIGIDKIAGSAFLGRAASGAIASAATQGIGVATGLQSKFDWAGVAGAGIGAGAGQALGGKLDGLGKFGTRLAATTAGGIANAAARSLVNGTDFGDNLIAALPDIIGQTVGSWAAGEIRGSGSRLHWHPDEINQPGPAGTTSGSDPLDFNRYLIAPDDGAFSCQQTRIGPNGQREVWVKNISTGQFGWTPDGNGPPSSPTQWTDESHTTIKLNDQATASLTSFLESAISSVGYAMNAIGGGITDRFNSIIGGLSEAATNAYSSISDFTLNMVWGQAPDMFDYDINSHDGRQEYFRAYSDYQANAAKTFGTFAMVTLQANRPSMRSGLMSGPIKNPAINIETQFQANSLRLANDAHLDFMREIQPGGNITLNPKLSMEIQRGGYVDREVRRGNLVLRAQLGLDATTVRINQRLYGPNGRYTVPDLYFPRSTNSIDYSYALKTARTPQILRMLEASPAGNVTIVPPAAVRPIYTIRPSQ